MFLPLGFAVHQGRSIFKALANRLDETEDLEVVLCIDIRREIGSTADVAQILKGYAAKFVETEWPGERFPRLYYDPRSLSSESGVRSALHAKCVAVDSMEALVTSANFTEAAQLRNIELGLHVKSPPIARQIEGPLLLVDQKRAPGEVASSLTGQPTNVLAQSSECS